VVELNLKTETGYAFIRDHFYEVFLLRFFYSSLIPVQL